MTHIADTARLVLLKGLQHWGQSGDEQIRAWQGAFDYMGLSIKLGIAEEDGNDIFTFDGTDTETAKQFMGEVQKNFPLGKFQKEQSMIEGFLKKYNQKQPA